MSVTRPTGLPRRKAALAQNAVGGSRAPASRGRPSEERAGPLPGEIFLVSSSDQDLPKPGLERLLDAFGEMLGPVTGDTLAFVGALVLLSRGPTAGQPVEPVGQHYFPEPLMVHRQRALVEQHAPEDCHVPFQQVLVADERLIRSQPRLLDIATEWEPSIH